MTLLAASPAEWGQVIAALSVLSMFLGAIAAIGQRDIKRLMAYSSIAHMGLCPDRPGGGHRMVVCRRC